jgi:putative hydroxymethylpyrimidine transporter CytX
MASAAVNFEPVDAGARAEVGRNLEAPVPRALGGLDQAGLWGNLGVSLLGFTGAVYVLQPSGGPPDLSLLAGLTAIIVGTVLGTVPIALAAIPGARTGAPAMVLLRGVFGGRASYLPTILNVAQCLGWATFELWTIASAAKVLEPGLAHWAYVVIGGVVSAALAVHPLGFIRTLRRYVTGLVVLVLAFLLIEMLRQPLPALGTGTWSGFWAATDTVVGAAISFAPLASDYSRHSRTGRAAFGGVLAGYGITQILCYGIGFMALLSVTKGNADPARMYGAFRALPVLGLASMAILVTRELDQSFANVYSTAASIQNFGPRLDRRILAVGVSVVSTVAALGINTGTYENFLTLIGSVFVPLSAVMIVDWFISTKGSWDLSARAPARWGTVLAWAAGFVAYQMINPGYVGWWVHIWTRFDALVGFQAQTWMSASILSFATAGVAAIIARPRR